MPSPYQAGTGAATTAEAYATQRKIEQLCDGSYLALIQTAITTLKLVQVTSPSGSPSFTTLAQTFVFSGANNIVGDLFILNNGTTTSDVWVAWSDNSTNTGLFVAHGTYTASGSTWSWDNASTSIALGSYTSGFMLPSVVWTGSNLILVCRANVTNYGIAVTYTTTKNGSSGWSALATLDGGGLGSHCYPLIAHDATNACSIIVYSLANDTVYGVVLADSSTPSVANWNAGTRRVTLSGGSAVGVGAANISAVLDTANQRLHVVYGNSSASTNPLYVTATYTTTSIGTPSSPLSVDSGATTFTGPAIGLDAASPPSAYVFWATGAVGSASDIEYAKIASPYTSVGSATNLTNASANDNAYPHVPVQSAMSGYAPLLYAHAKSPWAVEYDNSIAVASPAHTLGALTRAQSYSRAALSAPARSHFLVESALTQLLAAGRALWKNRAALDASARVTFRVNGPIAGTGIGDITRSTGTQTANLSGNGYGTGDITGTAHDYSYKDVTGSGWAIEANPWYGGMPSSGWYQLDPTLNTTLPQKTSLTGNLQSLLTTQRGGQMHWEEAAGAGFASSELVTFQNAGNFTELAPANTPFRAYVKAIGEAADANGISWTAWMCIYPGDPGFIVFRFDQHNGSGAAITADESDIEVIASLLTDTGSPAGAWNASNGFIGTIGGSVINGWPADSVHQNGTFDFMGITPDVSSGLSLGIGAAVLSDPSSDFGWTNGGYEAHITAASGNPGRIKIGWYSDVSSNWTIPNGQTNTYYVLRVFRRNLTSTDMAAIAADWKFPGTPTTTQGSFTSFSVDERAYVFAAAGGSALRATLDMTPAHVTVRYKPIVKIIGWTDSNAPVLTWGGAALTAGADYRWVYDATNQVLYLQLYFDVVSSGATTGQRNNAALSVQGLHGLMATLRTRQEIATGAGFSTSARWATRAPLAGAARSAFVSRAVLAAESRMRAVTRAGLAAASRARFQTRITALAGAARARFASRAGLAAAARGRFLTRLALDAVTEATYKVRSTLTQLATLARAHYVTRTSLASASRARFFTRLGAATQARTHFMLRQALATASRATFGLRTTLTQLAAMARTRFTTRAALTSPARGAFFARHPLAATHQARFATRTGAGLATRARFAVRIGLGAPTRAAFRVGLALRAVARATFRTFGAFALAARATYLVKALGLGWHGPGVGETTTASDAAAVSATADDRAKITATIED